MREKVTSAPKPLIPQVKHDYSSRPIPKVLQVPKGELQTANLSIKKMMEKSAEDIAPGISPDDLPKKAFTYDDIKRLWRKYAFEMRNQGKDTIYHAMVRREPHLIDDTIIKMELDNQVQFDYITPLTSDLIGFIRKELSNYQVTLELFITQDVSKEIKFMTGKDKFTALAKKNPNLHKLMEILNLEIEY